MRMLIYLSVPEYLCQFLYAKFGDPVVLPAKSNEFLCLKRLISVRPKNVPPDLGTGTNLRIVIPITRVKNPIYYNHLTERAKSEFLNELRDLFDEILYSYVRSRKKRMKLSEIECVWQFMADYAIDPSFVKTLQKKLERRRNFIYNFIYSPPKLHR